jgi:RHS repeat-associated protein
MVGALLAAAGGGAQAAPSQPSIAEDVPAPPAGFVDPLSTPRGRTQLEAARRRAEADRDAALGPSNAAVRLASRTAYAGLTGDAARALALRRFGALLDHASTTPVEQAGARRVLSYLGDFSARIEDAGGRPRLLQSMTPLRTPELGGPQLPVDLTLAALDGRYRPVNPLTPVSLPQRLGDGFELARSGVRFGVEGVGARLGEVVDARRLVYAEADTDTDVIASAVPEGLELFLQLRSASSPEHLRLPLAPGQDATLRAAADGGADVLDGMGRVVAHVTAPTALDAAGRPVRVSMTADATALTLNVPHRDQEVEYPVLVDPIYEDWESGPGGQYSDPWYYSPNHWDGLSTWYFTQSSSPTAFAPRTTCYAPVSCYGTHQAQGGPGLYVYAYGSSTYNAGSYGEWIYESPGSTTYIPRAELGWKYYQRRGDTTTSPYLFDGTWSESTGWTAMQSFPSDVANDYNTLVPSGDVGGSHLVAFGMYTPSTYTLPNWRDGYLGGGWIVLDDPEAPSVPTISGSAVTSSWVRSGPLSVTATASDPGLGVEYFDFVLKNGAASVPYWTGCNGTAESPCAATASQTATIDPASIGDGVHQLGVWAEDPIRGTGHTSGGTSWQLKVDTTAPTIDLKGRLAGAQNRAVSSAMQLNVAGDDGPGQTSQTSSVSLNVAGTVVASKLGPASRLQLDPYTFDPSTRSMGPVQFQVDASDFAGNNAHSKTFAITVARGQLTTLMEGQRTAKRMVLQAKDLRPTDPQYGAASQVRFQYRRTLSGTGSAWQDVPVADLRTPDGQAVTSADLAMTNALSPKVVWDVASTIGSATTDPVFVRGYFGPQDGNSTEDVLTVVDPSGLDTDDASESLALGSVDLLTGNYALSSTDVSIDSFKSDLSITRTYNSRSIAATDKGPFGGGWTLGTPVLAAAAEFRSVTNYAETTPDPEDDSYGYASLNTNDGGELFFEEHGADTGYDSEPGLEDLALKRVMNADGTIAAFELTDRQTGDLLRFEHKDSSAPGVYELVKVTQPTSAVTTTFDYAPNQVNGNPGMHVTRMLAPVAPGIDCGIHDGVDHREDVGCRSLKLVWDSADHLTRVLFDAKGNGLTDDEVVVAQYDYDGAGRLIAAWDPRISPALKTTYRYDGEGRLAGVTAPGENEVQLEYQPAANDGTDHGRLKRLKRTTPQGAPGTPDGVATQTLQFGVPLSGSGAPYDMSPGQLAAWSQDDSLPTDAAAVFRPDDVPASDPPSSYAKATVHYLDGFGREVDEARPGGEVDTTEYDAAGHVVRELTAANRARALATGTTTAAHAARADQLDTQRTYAHLVNDDWRMTDELGPLHAVRLADGTSTSARRHTHLDYDETKPAGDQTIYNLPTTSTVSAQVSGVERDARVTKVDYDWALRLPTTVTVDPAGLNLRTTTVYDSQGLVLEQRLPRSPGTDAPSTRETVYYSAGANATDAACGGKPQWANLPCKVRAAAQPTGTLPSLPTTVLQYDAYEQPTQEQDYVDGVLRRTTTTGYDAAGRRTSVQVTGAGGGVGTDPATSTYSYSSTTGDLTSTSTPGTTPVRTISRTYDAVGRVSTYTDADGATTTTRYDLLGRPTTVSEGGGASQTLTYDTTTGRLAEVNDATVGRMTASAYDADGQLTRETFQTAGLDLVLRYDETGDAVQRTYRKVTNCASACDWLDWQAASSVHGQWLSQTGTDGTRTYAYDASGRLTQAQDQPTGSSCTTRTYQFDADSNRTHALTFPAGTGGACSTATTPVARDETYDEADRANASGYAYDVLGRIQTVPAASAGGNQLDATYYADDDVRSLTQGGATTTMDRDPEGRVRARTTSPQAAVVSHYGDEGDEPAWTEQGTATTRNVSDLVGDLAAVQTSAGGLTLELTDLHGDVAAEIPNSATASPPTSFSGTDEFGVPRPGAGGLPIQRITTAHKALTAAATSMGIVKPTGTAPDDLIVAQIAGAANATITAPSGWTAVAGGEVNSGGTRYKLFYKVAGASEPTAYSFSFSQSGLHAGGLTLFRNTAQQGPIDAAATGSGNSVDITAPSVTPSVGGDAHLVFAGRDSGDSNGGSVFGFPAPLTKEWERKTGTTATDRSSGAGLRILVGGAGAPTGSVTVTNQTGYGATTWGAVTIAIKPAQSGPARNQVQYGYLGAKQRNTTLPSGTIEMGQRVYVPQLGRFLQVDPVYGGSANDYDYAGQDPVNNVDLDGECIGPVFVVCAIGVEEAIGLVVGAVAAGGAAVAVHHAVTHDHGGLPHIAPPFHLPTIRVAKKKSRGGPGKAPTGPARPERYRRKEGPRSGGRGEYRKRPEGWKGPWPPRG